MCTSGRNGCTSGRYELIIRYVPSAHTTLATPESVLSAKLVPHSYICRSASSARNVNQCSLKQKLLGTQECAW